MLVINDSNINETSFSLFKIIEACKEIYNEIGGLPYISITTKIYRDANALLEFTQIEIDKLLPAITNLRNILSKELVKQGILDSDSWDFSNTANVIRDNGCTISTMITFYFNEVGKCFRADSYGENDIIISVNELKSLTSSLKYLI